MGFGVPPKSKHILVIGGGYGVVPLFFLAKLAREVGIEPTAVIGGRSDKDVIYEKHFFGVCKEVFVTTDDGSRGKKGTVMAEAQWLIESKKFDCVYCCGPERMMHAVATLCQQHKIPCQLSIERYMKCGVGICGACAIGDKLTCVDGPVFGAEEALKLNDFGGKHRDATGQFK
jgi:dihydroorotate dehydrogenase electron transfer subunit